MDISGPIRTLFLINNHPEYIEGESQFRGGGGDSGVMDANVFLDIVPSVKGKIMDAMTLRCT